jgi:hypothetical protein
MPDDAGAVLDRVRGVSAKAGAGEEGYAVAATVS